MKEEKPILISSKELCEVVPMSESSLRKYLKDDKFPRYMVHGDFKFKLQEVLDFLRVKND